MRVRDVQRCSSLAISTVLTGHLRIARTWFGCMRLVSKMRSAMRRVPCQSGNPLTRDSACMCSYTKFLVASNASRGTKYVAVPGL